MGWRREHGVGLEMEGKVEILKIQPFLSIQSYLSACARCSDDRKKKAVQKCHFFSILENFADFGELQMKHVQTPAVSLWVIKVGHGCSCCVLLCLINAHTAGI
jgi:hypothetical protein